MRDNLTAEELAIVEALRDCEESDLSREIPRGQRMTLDQIGSLLSVTKERVRQIEATALKKMRRKIVLDTKLRAAFRNINQFFYDERRPDND